LKNGIKLSSNSWFPSLIFQILKVNRKVEQNHRNYKTRNHQRKINKKLKRWINSQSQIISNSLGDFRHKYFNRIIRIHFVEDQLVQPKLVNLVEHHHYLVLEQLHKAKDYLQAVVSRLVHHQAALCLANLLNLLVEHRRVVEVCLEVAKDLLSKRRKNLQKLLSRKVYLERIQHYKVKRKKLHRLYPTSRPVCLARNLLNRRKNRQLKVVAYLEIILHHPTRRNLLLQVVDYSEEIQAQRRVEEDFLVSLVARGYLVKLHLIMVK